MKKVIYYLSRVLSILIVCFFAVFILEGFGPDFGWQDSLMHGILAFVVLMATMLAWKKPKIGGWVFIVFGLWYLKTVVAGYWLNGLIIGGIPLITGVLFLIQGFKKIDKNF
jgi:hypothetical protein